MFLWKIKKKYYVDTPLIWSSDIMYNVIFQVDIFSYAMMIYETLTGKRPYQEFENMSQISKAIKSDDKRPSIGVMFCLL